MQILRDRRTWAIAGVVVIAVVAAALAVGRGGEDPATSRFTSAAATLSVIGGDVQVRSDDGATPRAAQDGEALAAGMTVEPQAPDGRAVLTFRDGSTQELEPKSSVRIEELSLGTRGELIVRLYQRRGKTWSYVQPQLSPNSRFHVKTPSATAVARGTSFELDVNSAGVNGTAVTKVTVFEGRVDLVAGGAVVPVAASHTSEVAAGGAPLPAQRVSPSDLCMRIDVSSEALITVTDPHGRSAGLTPKGALNQIPRTIVTGPQTDPQAIDVFSPAAGSWEIGIVPRDEGGPLQLRVVTAVDGQLVDMRALVTTLGLGQRVVTSVRLDPDGRGGSFAPPVQTTATTAVGLPSDVTTTAPLPRARLLPANEDPRALACIPVEALQQPSDVKQPFDVKPVRSPEQTSGR